MAIDITSETLIALAEVANSLPRRRAGKRPHVSCIYRLTTTGYPRPARKVGAE